MISTLNVKAIFLNGEYNYLEDTLSRYLHKGLIKDTNPHQAINDIVIQKVDTNTTYEKHCRLLTITNISRVNVIVHWTMSNTVLNVSSKKDAWGSLTLSFPLLNAICE